MTNLDIFATQLYRSINPTEKVMYRGVELYPDITMLDAHTQALYRSAVIEMVKSIGNLILED